MNIEDLPKDIKEGDTKTPEAKNIFFKKDEVGIYPLMTTPWSTLSGVMTGRSREFSWINEASCISCNEIHLRGFSSTQKS